MAEICHLENRHDVIFFCWGWYNLDKISQTGADRQVNCGDMVKIETRCRIPLWRTFWQIRGHVIPEPPATLQGAATWRIQCHNPRATCHIAECCHLVNSLSWFQSHIPHCRVQSPGEISVMIVPHCRCSNSIHHIENRFSPYFIFFVLMQFGLWRAVAFLSSSIHLL